MVKLVITQYQPSGSHEVERAVNFKNMTYKEISRMASGFDTTRSINSALHQLNELIESLNILKNMLEGRRVLQLQKDRLSRRKRLKVVSSKKQK